MKVLVNGEEILNITDTMKKIICDDVSSDIIDADIKRRIKWVIEHKCEFNMERLKKTWLPKLKERGIASIPLDDFALAELIFAQEDYKDAKKRAGEQEKQLLSR